MKLYKVGPMTWAVRHTIHRHFSGEGSRGLAERYRQHLHSGICDVDTSFREGTAPCCTIRGKLDAFIDDCTAGLDRRPCNQETARLHRRRLLVFDAAFHTKPLDAITAAEVERWMRRRRKVVSADTVNADLVSLRAFAAWAKKRGEAPRVLDIDGVGRMRSTGKLPGQNRMPPEVLEIHVVLGMIDRVKALRPDIGLFFEGMLYFNLRPDAVAALRRSDLRLPTNGRDGALESEKRKGLYDRTLPVRHGSEGHRWAKECIALAKLHRFVGDHPLIICIKGRRRDDPGSWTTGTLDKAAARVLRKIGMDCRPYVIRHSIITWLQNQPGISTGAIQAHAAHADPTTQKAYSHRTARDALPAFEAIDVLLREHREKSSAGDQGGVV